jgi:hypothetical protein
MSSLYGVIKNQLMIALDKKMDFSVEVVNSHSLAVLLPSYASTPGPKS